MVHAGVVGWRGRAIVIPGRGLSGKTTLVAALVRAGARYYSDELAVLDRRGRVHPRPIPLKLREPGGELAGTMHPVETLGGRPGVRPLPVGVVILTRFRPGAPWRPRRASSGRAILGLLRLAVTQHGEEPGVLAILRTVVDGALVLQGARGEAAEVVPALLRAVERPRRAGMRRAR